MSGPDSHDTPLPPLDDPWEPLDPYRAEQRLERRRRLHGMKPRSDLEILTDAALREFRVGDGDRVFKGLG